jgi:hypothetical protein
VGDFNTILSQTEKQGAALKPHRQIEDFQRALEDCKLCDMGFIGPKFTWNNGRNGGEYTTERLDRGVANEKWYGIHGDVEEPVLASRSSDHNLFLVSFQPKDEIKWQHCKKFRVEASWSKHS